jgi:pyridoxal phosphate enzyme (YggS family)
MTDLDGGNAIAARLEEIRARIVAAARSANRDPQTITLVAVTKTVDVARIREAVAAGQRDFGENYAQELRDKAAALGDEPRWHFIGPLQRNKVKYVVGTSALVHSVDSESLAGEIAARAKKLDIVQPCLLQVNVGDESQKSGCSIDTLPALLDASRAHRSLRIEGLMCIPPAAGDPRPQFVTLRTLAERHGLGTLSMGMSADYEAAIAEGATHVRVGTAIFGAR